MTMHLKLFEESHCPLLSLSVSEELQLTQNSFNKTPSIYFNLMAERVAVVVAAFTAVVVVIVVSELSNVFF